MRRIQGEKELLIAFFHQNITGEAYMSVVMILLAARCGGRTEVGLPIRILLMMWHLF